MRNTGIPAQGGFPVLPRSLSGRLVVLWSLSLAAALLAVGLLVGFARQSSLARSDRAAAVAQTACGLIREQFAFYAAGSGAQDSLPPRRDLAAVVTIGLSDLPATVGGIWASSGPLVAVRGGPSESRGSGSVAGFPGAELLARMVAQVARDDFTAQAQAGGLAVSACPLPGPWPDLVAWAASSSGASPLLVGGNARSGLRVSLGFGLAVLLLLILGIALWSSGLLLAWRRALARLERAVRQATLAEAPAGQGVALRPAGEPGLDRVVIALNESGRQLAEAQSRAAAAARLAALGRVAAGIAHEVRNPIAAIRLRAENAIASSDERRAAALPAILAQIARLERLTASLLDMTRARIANPVACDLRVLVTEIAEVRFVGETAIELTLKADAAQVCLDPELIEAALGNLILNAVQHARSRVVVAGVVVGGQVRLTVSDDGDGVAPGLRATLFDPFVTGRAEGTGLGLAIAREAVSAHGGAIILDADMPSRFVIEIPQ